MAYRTYKNLFRVKAEISSIGEGPVRMRLPEGMTVTFDMLFVLLVTLIPARLLVSPIIAAILQTHHWGFIWGYALMVAGAVAVSSRKLEPAGKSIFQYSVDLVTFFFRGKWHDGWTTKKVRLYQGQSFEVHTYYLDQDACASFPAAGEIDEFELRVPAALNLRGRKLFVSTRGKKQPPGKYRIEGRRIVQTERSSAAANGSSSSPPAVKRKRKGGSDAK